MRIIEVVHAHHRSRSCASSKSFMRIIGLVKISSITIKRCLLNNFVVFSFDKYGSLLKNFPVQFFSLYLCIIKQKDFS